MAEHLSQFLPPPEAAKILIVLALSFLIGLEREEHKAEGDYCFGGGYAHFPHRTRGIRSGFAFREPIGASLHWFCVVGAFLLMSYRHRLSACGQAVAEAPGVTTEISGLTTYVLGALVCNGYFWIAATIAVVSLFLLELKGVLEAVDDLNAWQRFHEFGERRPTRCRGSDGR